MAVDVGSAVGYLDLDISGFLAGLKSAQSEADKKTKSIATKIGNNLSNTGKKLTSAGTTLTKGITVPVAAAGGAIVKMSSQFEAAMSRVQAISGASGKDLVKLTDKAKELGATTAWSASEVADGMTEMAKAGWGTQQILDGMGGVLDAASASGENLASVATIVADAITGFGMEAKDATRVADLLTQAANAGTIDITDLGESFKYIAPVASTMGFSIEEVTTAISAMSMAGIKGSQAGTSLRTMLTRMVKPTDAVADAMNELGIKLTKQDGSFKSLNTIVSEMRGKFSGLSDQQKTYYATVLAGQEGMSGLLSLLNLTEEEYNAISKSMDNANGVAKETADVMLNNLTGQTTILKSALEGLAIQFGDAILPTLKKFTAWVRKVTEKLQSLTPEQKQQIVKWAAIAAAIGPVLVAFGKVTTAVGGIVTTFGKIPGAISKVKTGFDTFGTGLKNVKEGFTLAKAGFSGLAAEAGGFGTKIGAAAAGVTGPMIAIVAVVAVVIAAFASLWKNNEEFRDKITGIWNQIKDTFQNFTQGIVDRLNSLGFNFESITDVLKAVWEGFCNFLAPIFEGVFQNIANIFKTVTNVILGVVDFFIAVFKGDWEGAWNAIKGNFETIWIGIKDWFSNILNTIKGIFDVILGWFGTSWDECWTSIKDFFVNTWTSISDFFKGIWSGITTFLSSAWETIKNVVTVGIMFIKELFLAAFQIITLPFRFIWENCKDTIISIWETIKSTITAALNAIKNVIMTVWNAVKSIFLAVWNPIKNFIVSIWDGIKNVISTVLNAIKIVITNVFNAIKTFVTNIWNNIRDAISGPINTAKNTVSNVVDSIKNKITSGFTAAKNTASNIFNSIKNAISKPMNAAKDAVHNAIEKIKSKFKFTWSLPKLKLPHPKITGNFSLNPPSVPHFSIDWYKKAMGDGMILNTATIFGFNSKTGKFLGGGESGSETVVGTKSLLQMIKASVNDSIAPIISATYKLIKTSAELGYVTYEGFTKIKNKFEDKYDKDKYGSNSSGKGDTYNFYSPKAIDEIEAARQLKKTKRELAEGF